MFAVAMIASSARGPVGSFRRMLSYVLIAWPIVSNHGRVWSMKFGVSGQSGWYCFVLFPVAGDLPLAVDHCVHVMGVGIFLHQGVVGVAGLDVAIVEEVALGEHEHRVLLDRRWGPRSCRLGIFSAAASYCFSRNSSIAFGLASRAICSLGPGRRGFHFVVYLFCGSRPGRARRRPSFRRPSITARRHGALGSAGRPRRSSLRRLRPCTLARHRTRFSSYVFFHHWACQPPALRSQLNGQIARGRVSRRYEARTITPQRSTDADEQAQAQK